MICRHNKTGTGVCDILGGYCVEGPCSAEELIEYAPVKKAHWIKKGNERTCSGCGFIYYSNNDDWNYCPNCGAGRE